MSTNMWRSESASQKGFPFTVIKPYLWSASDAIPLGIVITQEKYKYPKKINNRTDYATCSSFIVTLGG